MTKWTWTYQLIDEEGRLLSRLIADHDDERLEEIQARFTEFLRGCGYTVPERNRDGEMLDEAMRLLHEYDRVNDPGERWASEYLELCKDYEEAME